MGRFALGTVFIASLFGCTLADAPPTPTPQPLRSAALAGMQRPTASPTYEPGPASASGAIIRIEAGRVVIRNPDGEVNVDLSGVRSVWKETEVTASDLEVGDQVDLNGTWSGTAFHARYVWADIGRFDGIVRVLVGQRLELVGLPPSTRLFDVELSPYFQIIRIDGTPATVADLEPGTIVGGVMYRPKNATPRATKIWLSRY